MKKIVLYNPQADRIYWRKGHPPLPLMAISSFLTNEDYEIDIFDYRQKEETLRSAEDSICVGITSMTGHQIYDGLLVARRIKKEYPHVPIVWGGWHPTILPGETIKNEFVDIVVRGQGERTFTELVKVLEENGDLSKILGISYKESGNIISNPARPFEDVNNFPPLPYHLIDIERYVARTRLGKRTIGYITSQGCPFHCGFCAEQVVYGRRWSALKPQRVAAEMRHLVNKYRMDSIIVSDSNFFVDEQRVRDICEKVKDLHITWGQVNGRTDTLSRYSQETWGLMQESGLQYLLTGAESGSEECLEIIQKEATVQDTFALTRIAKFYNIRIQFSLFIGTPDLNPEHSTKDELNKTLDLIYQLHRINRSSEFLLFVYGPYPGTPLYGIAKQFGFKEPSTFEEWSCFDLNEKHIPWVADRYVRLTWDITYYLFFISGSLQRTINNYSFLVRIFLFVAALPFYFIVMLRFKYKFFWVPLDMRLIRLILKSKNTLQEMI